MVDAVKRDWGKKSNNQENNVYVCSPTKRICVGGLCYAVKHVWKINYNVDQVVCLDFMFVHKYCRT